MGVREQFQKMIDRKGEEIKDLELQIEKARTYIQALQDSMRLLPKDLAPGDQLQTLRPGTALAKAQDVLKAEGKAMHITDLLKAMGKPTDKRNRLSLSGSISTYVRNGQIFSRPAPNTFGLLDLKPLPESAPRESPEIPEDFGEMA
jgi:hypothetical protein